MLTKKSNFPSIIPDNTETYIKHLEASVESIDYACNMEITNLLNGINVRIAPSSIQFLGPLIQRINKLHNSFGIMIQYSKSMKASSSINFIINFG